MAKIAFSALWLAFNVRNEGDAQTSSVRAAARETYPRPLSPNLEVLIWSIVTSHQYKAWCYHLPPQYNTQQCRLAEFLKNPINQEFSGREFKFNLPKEEASCTLLKHVRVQGFKGLWHRLTASGQGQLLSALVLGVGQGLMCKWWEWQWQLSLIVSYSVWFCKRKWKGVEGGNEEYGRTRSTIAETISVHWIQLGLKRISGWNS